jgi:ribosomal protein S14
MFYKDSLHYLNKKDYILKKKFYLNELQKIILKNFIYDLRIKLKFRFILKNFKLNFKLNNICKLHQHCLFTGKTRFIFSYFNLNRSSLKFYSSYGFISGFSKW